MKSLKLVLFSLVLFCIAQINVNAQATTYTMPAEDLQHEGTWLQWPHHYTYGTSYRDRLDQTWIDMTAALITSEKVHVVVYNSTEKTRVINLLNTASVSLDSIDFYIIKTDDVWIRDNGPIYVYNNTTDALTILDWNFDGWGDDTPFALDNKIPGKISTKTGVPKVNLSAMVLEGGAVQIDGNGTFLGTRSSILEDHRNDGLTETEVNDYLTQYLGVTNIIWLDGYYGASWDVTDAHIDGFASFVDDETIVTMNDTDLNYWGLTSADRTTLFNAQNAAGDDYNFIYLPLTDKNVKTTWGVNVGFKSSYTNYYIANSIILFPTFNDVNDDDAIAIIQSIYPDKTIVGIDNRNIYYYGGMAHCVTQQQPVGMPMKLNGNAGTELIENNSLAVLHQNFPNPFNEQTEISFELNEAGFVELEIYTITGSKVSTLVSDKRAIGNYSVMLNASNLESGIYFYTLKINNQKIATKKLQIIK